MLQYALLTQKLRSEWMGCDPKGREAKARAYAAKCGDLQCRLKHAEVRWLQESTSVRDYRKARRLTTKRRKITVHFNSLLWIKIM